MTLTQVLPAQHPHALTKALEHLRAGELVAFPTDTVYGLGADLYNPEAIHKLYIAKGRDAGKAIAVLIGDVDALKLVAGAIPPGMQVTIERLVECFWPGALTLVVPRNPDIPGNLSPSPTIGVRMPDLEITLKLLKACGPLAVTSANISGAHSSTTPEEVSIQLGCRIALILDGGQTPGGLASTVLDCTRQPPEILRRGPISQNEIERCISGGY